MNPCGRIARDFMYDQKRCAKNVMEAIEENTDYFNLDDASKSVVRKVVMSEFNGLYRKLLTILRALGHDIVNPSADEDKNGADV